MDMYVNRRIRERAMVLGLPAEYFMMCLGIMVAPIVICIFVPIAFIMWPPWMYGVYYFFRNFESILRTMIYSRQYPSHLKNR